jgi:hypothetical protein
VCGSVGSNRFARGDRIVVLGIRPLLAVIHSRFSTRCNITRLLDERFQLVKGYNLFRDELGRDPDELRKQ